MYQSDLFCALAVATCTLALMCLDYIPREKRKHEANK